MSEADLDFCLSLGFAPERLTAARERLVSRWPQVTEAALKTRTESVLAHVLAQSGVLAGVPALRLGNGKLTPPLWIADVWVRHLARRAALASQLERIVEYLNDAGLIPLLLKGARSLWLDAPQWRSMRDLDLLLPSWDEAIEAQKVLMAAGYVEGPEGMHPPRFYHANNLYREDLPGWIEIHRRAGPHRVEVLLPSRELLAVGTLVTRDNRRALVLPPSHDVLHGVAHHYFGHREGRNASIEIKGLIEFALAYAELSSAERQAIVHRAGWNSRLLAILDVWIAAAADRFGLTKVDPLKVEWDARRRWQGLRTTTQRPSKLAALGEELALALAPARLRRCRGGKRAAGRVRMRFSALLWAGGAFGDRMY